MARTIILDDKDLPVPVRNTSVRYQPLHDPMHSLRPRIPLRQEPAPLAVHLRDDLIRQVLIPPLEKAVGHDIEAASVCDGDCLRKGKVDKDGGGDDTDNIAAGDEDGFDGLGGDLARGGADGDGFLAVRVASGETGGGGEQAAGLWEVWYLAGRWAEEEEEEVMGVVGGE